MSILFKHKINWQYAIGEIILIFIGITLAIAFNNWNDRRIQLNNQKEQSALLVKSIYNDLVKEQKYLGDVIEDLNEQKLGSDYLLKIVESDNNDIHNLSMFFKNHLIVSTGINVNRNENSWDELNAKGLMYLIPYDSLQSLLNTFYTEYDFSISNFKELPREVRLKYRKLGAPCATTEALRKQHIDKVEYPHDRSFIECLMNQDNYKALLLQILDSSYFNIPRFKALKEKSQYIVSYMEEAYPHILGLQ